jgi:hypothetical protein
MLLELAKPVALLLCLLSLYAVFHTVFFTIEDPQLLLQPHQAIRDRIIDSLLLLALSAGISLIGGLIFRESEPAPHPSLSATLPLQIFYWATASCSSCSSCRGSSKRITSSAHPSTGKQTSPKTRVHVGWNI